MMTAPAVSVEFSLMVLILKTEIKGSYQEVYLSIDKYPGYIRDLSGECLF